MSMELPWLLEKKENKIRNKKDPKKKIKNGENFTFSTRRHHLTVTVLSVKEASL
jgi:hypothetical protein